MKTSPRISDFDLLWDAASAHLLSPETCALSYRYQGVYAPLSVEARHARPIHQIHVLMLQWTGR